MAPTKKEKKQVEGPIWVASNGTVWREKPTLDADEVLKLRENYYWAGVRENLGTLVYRDRYTLDVLDPELKSDEDLTSALSVMVSRPEVDLWSKLCMVLPDWYDWGLAFFNDVWDGSGTTGDPYELKQLRRLPPELFRKRPLSGSLYVWSELLPGINYNESTGEVEYWITEPTTLQTKQIRNVFVARDPTVPDLGGRPMIRPVVSVIRMLDFAWGAQMQQTNRIGAPIMFIRMEAWTDDDVTYAKQILRNWGKDTQYPLRPGMELVTIPVKEGTVALDTIDRLAGMVIDFFASAKFVAKDGTLIGGSAQPELDITYAFIAGIHRKLEANVERLLQPWLDENGYTGYTVRCHIPSPSLDRTEINLRIAQEIRAGGLGDPVRYLALLGEEGYSTEEIEGFAAWWKEHGAPSATPFGFADTITNARETAAEGHHASLVEQTKKDLDERMTAWEKRLYAAVEDAE